MIQGSAIACPLNQKLYLMSNPWKF
jgi:hypothetical protein